MTPPGARGRPPHFQVPGGHPPVTPPGARGRPPHFQVPGGHPPVTPPGARGRPPHFQVPGGHPPVTPQGARGRPPHFQVPGGHPPVTPPGARGRPPHFQVPGGHPRGDPPGVAPWLGSLDAGSRRAFETLRDAGAPIAPADLAADGWLRADFPPWAGLWHAAPGGWCPMPGHGHQDVGGFELHVHGEALFVDLGRGAYGERGDAALYAGAAAHNTVHVDGADPYPQNKPYYDDAYRRRVGGPPPRLELERSGVTLVHHGFARLSGVGALTRRWRFAARAVSIADRLEGTGTHTVSRLLHTILPAERRGDAVLLHGRGGSLRLCAEARPRLCPAVRWTAYGRGQAATSIVFEARLSLPFESRLDVEIL